MQHHRQLRSVSLQCELTRECWRWGGGRDVAASAQELHGKTPAKARSWALGVVEEIVEQQVRARCWEKSVRDGRSPRKGWAFDSLLGAMWLQMQWLMRSQPQRCEWCGALLDMGPEQVQELETATEDTRVGRRRKPRSDRRFCPDTTCRQKWNYHNGTGASSKKAKRERYRHKHGGGEEGARV